jgi:hypothetical protein
MMYKLAACLAIFGFANACDETSYVTCEANLGIVPTDSEGYCLYVNSIIGCIGAAGCCGYAQMDAALDAIKMTGDLLGLSCTYASCSSGGSGSGDKPCFSFDSYAVNVHGDSVPMASLRSGDYVMDGPDSYTRVIVNQHASGAVKSSLLQITAGAADVKLTPDHVLAVDGEMAAARTVVVGSKLGEFPVSRITSTSGAVINPLTASGKILTEGGILASTYPEWIADYMLSSTLFPLPISLSNAFSYLFPEKTQNYYDAVVEGFVNRHHPVHLKDALPQAALPVAFFLGDLAVSAGFVGYNLASAEGLAALAVIVCAVKAMKK